MNKDLINNRDLITMKLLYYFITVKNYNPIIVQGASNEIWLENLNMDYKIVRIVNNYIHNNDQLDFDIFKTKRLVKKIKKKTFSFNVKVLNFFTDLGENVNLNNVLEDKYSFINVHDEKDIFKDDIIQSNFSDLKKNFSFSEEGFNLFLKITNEINIKNKQEAEHNEMVFEPKKPIITISIIIILSIIYLIGILFNIDNDLINTFALHGPTIRIFHQYYRFITGTLLHGNLFHLLSNCYALYIIGTQIESFYGKGKYLIIYLYSALCGSLMSVALSNNASIGASGAIFGLMGSLLYFGYHYRIYIGSTWKDNLMPVIIINLIIGFIVPGIDYLGHIGGLIGGILISMAVGLKYKSTKNDYINGIILSSIFVIFLAYLGIFMK